MDRRHTKFLQLISYYPNDLFSEKGFGEFFRLFYFEKGAGVVSINGIRQLLVAPCCLTLNERDTVELYIKDKYLLHTLLFNPVIINSSFSYESIHMAQPDFTEQEELDLSWLQTFLKRDEHYGGLMLAGPSTGLRLLELLTKVSEEIDRQSDAYWPCRSRSYLYELFNVLNAVHDHPYRGDHLTIRESDELIDSIIKYLNEYYHQKIAIPDLTERFQVDRTTLSEKFLAATGLSVISYLTKVRIRMASLLLVDTSLPVSEIMYRVGYEDPSHFGRLFKRETSFSPSEFRKIKSP